MSTFLSFLKDCLPFYSKAVKLNGATTSDSEEDNIDITHHQQLASTTTVTTTIKEYITRLLKSILPRRCHEPTGPLALFLDMLLSLFVPCGAHRSTINKLPQFTICTDGLEVDSIDEKCPICLAPYEEGDVVRQLICKHIFHTEVSCFPKIFRILAA